jgi:hypothetical protein
VLSLRSWNSMSLSFDDLRSAELFHGKGNRTMHKEMSLSLSRGANSFRSKRTEFVLTIISVVLWYGSHDTQWASLPTTLAPSSLALLEADHHAGAG